MGGKMRLFRTRLLAGLVAATLVFGFGSTVASADPGDGGATTASADAGDGGGAYTFSADPSDGGATGGP